MEVLEKASGLDVMDTIVGAHMLFCMAYWERAERLFATPCALGTLTKAERARRRLTARRVHRLIQSCLTSNVSKLSPQTDR